MEKNHFSQIAIAKNSKSFGLLPDGTEIYSYTLFNKNGFELSVINYGATITELKIPVSASEKTDVVLGFKNLDDYINSYDLPSPPYFGTTVGRYAGRIKNAQFSINGKQISLNKNHGENNLHGGFSGFSRKVWNIIETSPESIKLEYVSPHNEENFPGELTVRVTYTLTDENELKVKYSAKSSEDTIVNLTQHSYFNLDGHQNDVTNQKLSINSDEITETDQELIPSGNFLSLKNHLFDFSAAKPCPASIDTTFALKDRNAATLISEKNKLKMTVTTNQAAVHVYVGGNCFHQIKGKENADYHPKSGICFEAQNFPDAPNHANFPTSVLRKGEEYNHQTIFKFENLLS